MCFGGGEGGVDKGVNQDHFTVDLLCGLVRGMQRRGGLKGLSARMAV